MSTAVTASVFEHAMLAATRLSEVMHVPTGIGPKPGGDDRPAIHVFACTIDRTAGFPMKFDGFDVVVEVDPGEDVSRYPVR